MFGSLFSDIIFFNKFISFLSCLEILVSRFSKFELRQNGKVWLKVVSFSNPKGNSLLKHFMQMKDSSLSSSQPLRFHLFRGWTLEDELAFVSIHATTDITSSDAELFAEGGDGSTGSDELWS